MNNHIRKTIEKDIKKNHDIAKVKVSIDMAHAFTNWR